MRVRPFTSDVEAQKADVLEVEANPEPRDLGRVSLPSIGSRALLHELERDRAAAVPVIEDVGVEPALPDERPGAAFGCHEERSTWTEAELAAEHGVARGIVLTLANCRRVAGFVSSDLLVEVEGGASRQGVLGFVGTEHQAFGAPRRRG